MKGYNLPTIIFYVICSRIKIANLIVLPSSWQNHVQLLDRRTPYYCVLVVCVIHIRYWVEIRVVVSLKELTHTRQLPEGFTEVKTCHGEQITK